MPRGLTTSSLFLPGCIVTVAAFTNAYRAMRKGDHHQVQRMFRARVIAQGFTVAAMVGGGLYYGAERNKEREHWKLQQEEKAEEKRQKWIRELETRDEEEKELRARLERRKERKKAADAEAARESFRAAEAKRQEGETPSTNPGENDTAAAGASSGWGLPGWVGGSSSPGPEQGEPSSSNSSSESGPSKK